MHVSILGLGAMGARMAARQLDAGHTLTVWNRSPERAADLASHGATVAMTPREAAESADVVLCMVTDNDASQSVWLGEDGALAGLADGAVAVDASTLTVAWVHELANRMVERGATFLDAPVAGSRPQADAGALISLVGGDASALDRARPVLDAYSGVIHHVGPTGQGAAMKLAVNALFATQVAAMGELFGALRGAGLEDDRIVEVLTAVPVTSPAAGGALRAMAAGAFDPLFPIDLVEKDLRYALELATDAPTTDLARAVYARAQEAGHGGENITAVAKLFL
ncbi:MAG: NAD(P)-dependent oxidoreductase [Bacteroidota bacterium]